MLCSRDEYQRGSRQKVRLRSPILPKDGYQSPIDVVPIDRTNYHPFQPLLYQVATASVSAPVVSAPIRHILRHEIQVDNLTILRAEVRHIDAKVKQVWLGGVHRLQGHGYR